MGPKMTSAISARCCNSRGAGARGLVGSPRRAAPGAGFTLIELLVVIGIIVILAALALPAIFKVWKHGHSIKGAADLQTIGTGLEAYKTENGDYPRVPVYP